MRHLGVPPPPICPAHAPALIPVYFFFFPTPQIAGVRVCEPVDRREGSRYALGKDEGDDGAHQAEPDPRASVHDDRSLDALPPLGGLSGDGLRRSCYAHGGENGPDIEMAGLRAEEEGGWGGVADLDCRDRVVVSRCAIGVERSMPSRPGYIFASCWSP